MADFKTNDDMFGRYVRIQTDFSKALHIYKVVSRFESNTYCDIPILVSSKEVKHEQVVPVLNVIHCGIDESKVIRVALDDCEIVPTENSAHATEYIDREDFKMKYLCCGYLLEISEQEFDAFPAADVAPVRHGRWERYGESLGECSECGEIVLICSNYCPNCGARMDKEAKHEAN